MTIKMSAEGDLGLDNLDIETFQQHLNPFSIPSPGKGTDIENKTTLIGYTNNRNAETFVHDLDILQSLDVIEANENGVNASPEFPTDCVGSSSDSSPQSQSDSQTNNLASLTLLDSQSNGNLSESLDEPSDSNAGFWSQVISSDTSVADGEQASSSGTPVKDWKQNALKYPPCAVCSGKSSGLHYGCYTCEACKNFFRRYLLRSGGFCCKKNNNCTIGNKSRGNCSGCRLKKCLEVGMSKEKSKIGRYTHSQRTETIREVKKLEGKLHMDDVDVKNEAEFEVEDLSLKVNETNAKISMNELGQNSEKESLTESLTEEEKELLETLTVAMDAIEHFGERGKTAEGRKQIIDEHYDRYLAKVKLIGPLKAIPKEEYFTLLKLYNIDLDGRWSLFKQEANNCAHIVERYCKFAYKIPGFQTISVKDQESLLKVGHCEFFVILMHEGYDHEKQIYLEMNGLPAHIEEASDKIFSRELIEIQAKIFQRWQKACLMKEEKTLLCAMSLVCSDRLDLENPTLVEKIHSDLTELLMKILRINYGQEAQKRFSKFIDILMFCRLASDAYFKEYQEMSKFDMVQEVAPAFPTLCPDKF
ncbi:vitamin D3 receptor A-like [Ruditapes philippinarum]|uniref:vitamin D3 receptor A-like n=1 Tax=Ruditapes philippinarum TaxID=129788 RepID=UPI00295A7908|nr:vitamin D3 receptor A-like [Ruditapes philippinarum]XP_060555581.1 vitamin D3 receptor A-like [Ruditapes philippinarum]XP_060555582.1 vitamin D3 receptor A-like [Ruditapes philippinarum]